MYCLDTYALYEIIEQNPKYLKFTGENFALAVPTLAELYIILYKRFSEKTAEYWLGKLKPKSQNANITTWVKAVKYRHEHRKQNLSIYDCLGYIHSIENGYVFVTGDMQFKDKKGVEYVK